MKVLILFFVTMCFVSASAHTAPEEYEKYHLLKETSKVSFGVCTEFYGNGYATPYKLEAPNIGFGAVVGSMSPDGWQISLVRTKTSGNNVRQVISDFNSGGNMLQNLKVRYDISTIRYEKYFNTENSLVTLLSLPAVSYFDVGLGAGVMDVRGEIENRYSHPTKKYVDAEETIGKNGLFGTLSVRFGIRSSHFGLGFSASRTVGGKIAGFLPVYMYLGNVTVRW